MDPECAERATLRLKIYAYFVVQWRLSELHVFVAT